MLLKDDFPFLHKEPHEDHILSRFRHPPISATRTRSPIRFTLNGGRDERRNEEEICGRIPGDGEKGGREMGEGQRRPMGGQRAAVEV